VLRQKAFQQSPKFWVVIHDNYAIWFDVHKAQYSTVSPARAADMFHRKTNQPICNISKQISRRVQHA
jgi:hypothetical protein